MTFRTEIIGDATLYLGDTFDVMPTLSGIDHVIGDPPYEKEAHKQGRRTQASVKRGENADLDFDAITEDQRLRTAAEGVRLSRGWLLLFCQAEAAGVWRDAIEAGGGKYKRTMVWIKPDSTPQLNGQMPAPGYESMPLAWCGAGHSNWNGGGKRGVYTRMTNAPDRHGVHKTEKPVLLMTDLIADFTQYGQTVLDPFMGSGTTGVACARLGRKFVGVELNETYFDIACRRIEQAYMQPRLFAEPPPKPVQTSMLESFG
jgi:site-specific DNA-methyltransferase (adenine-specific)